MAILRGFRDATIQENNIVQTVASAAGTLSSIIFVLPGLIMIGWWTEFPFWISFWICALGGILGVMYSIPLRRALVTTSDLPYPEGVACAEVLKIGSSSDSKHASDIEHGRAGLLAVLWGSIVAAVFAVVVQTQVLAADVAQTFRIGRRGAVSGYDFFLSFALLGIGHLVGLSVGIAMLIGALIGWGWGVPHFSAMAGDITTAAATLAQKPGAQRSASLVLARSAFRRFGRFSNSLNRWPEGSLVRWLHRAREKPAGPIHCRSLSATFRSALSDW